MCVFEEMNIYFTTCMKNINANSIHIKFLLELLFLQLVALIYSALMLKFVVYLGNTLNTKIYYFYPYHLHITYSPQHFFLLENKWYPLHLFSP